MRKIHHLASAKSELCTGFETRQIIAFVVLPQVTL